MVDFWGKEVRSSGVVTFFRTVTVRKWASTSDSASQLDLSLDSWMQTEGWRCLEGFWFWHGSTLTFAALDKTSRRLSESLLEIQVFFLDAASVGLNLWGMRDTYRDKVRYDKERTEGSFLCGPSWGFFHIDSCFFIKGSFSLLKSRICGQKITFTVQIVKPTEAVWLWVWAL